jgi:hypothetical protein
MASPATKQHQQVAEDPVPDLDLLGIMCAQGGQHGNTAAAGLRLWAEQLPFAVEPKY